MSRDFIRHYAGDDPKARASDLWSGLGLARKAENERPQNCGALDVNQDTRLKETGCTVPR